MAKFLYFFSYNPGYLPPSLTQKPLALQYKLFLVSVKNIHIYQDHPATSLPFYASLMFIRMKVPKLTFKWKFPTCCSSTSCVHKKAVTDMPKSLFRCRANVEKNSLATNLSCLQTSLLPFSPHPNRPKKIRILNLLKAKYLGTK